MVRRRLVQRVAQELPQGQRIGVRQAIPRSESSPSK
jgi:hypothetical protein